MIAARAPVLPEDLTRAEQAALGHLAASPRGALFRIRGGYGRNGRGGVLVTLDMAGRLLAHGLARHGAGQILLTGEGRNLAAVQEERKAARQQRRKVAS